MCVAVLAQDRPHSHPYVFANRPTNCEINVIRFEDVTKVAHDELKNDRVIIAIARLGSGETSRRLNSRRLSNVRAYLTAYQTFSAQQLITAEGDRVEGFGRVEIYVSGKLTDTILINRGEDLCVNCCESDNRYYPYRKLSKRTRDW